MEEEFEDSPQGETLDEALDRIIDADETDQSTEVEPEAEETPEPVAASDDVDESDLDRAYAAYRRDGRTAKEIDALLESEGSERFVARGLKRSKHYENIDSTFGELSRLKAKLEELESGKDGDDAHNAAPTLNPRDLVTPLAERLGLDEDGVKDLVALTEATSKASQSELQALREQTQMLGSILQSQIESEVRKEVGLDQVDQSEWETVQKHYQALLSTDLHQGMEGKARMSALMRSAAMLAGVEAADPKEIQRKASVARAKGRGKVTVDSGKKSKPKPKTKSQLEDEMIQNIIKGGFKSIDEAWEYGQRQHLES